MNPLRYALRSLVKAPGFSIVAILILALGIGLSAGSFSVTNAFLLRNVPYPEPDSLVRSFVVTARSDWGSFSAGNALAVRATAGSFTGVCLYNGDSYALGEPGQPAEEVQGLIATANFFQILGVQPFLGRSFEPDDDSPDKPPVAVISHRMWVRRYASDRAVIGRTVRLNSEPRTIVGVLPESFDAPLVWGAVDIVLPQTLHPALYTNFKGHWGNLLGRLKPGVSRRQAESELAVVAARLVKEHPQENVGIKRFRLVSLHDANTDDITRTLLWLMTAISLAMLLIACANLASLQVARAFGRAREFAIRSALGADRRRLMTPLLVESLLLAAVGGVSGLFIASWNNKIIGQFLRISSNEVGYDVPLDWRVFTFAVVVSVLSGLAFGLAPAWIASRAPAGEALKESSRGSTSSRSHQRLKSFLIVAELGLAVALVGVAASFGVGARSFIHRQVGWDPNGLFAGFVDLPSNRYGDDAKCRLIQKTLLEKVSLIPGVDHAALSGNLPLFSLGRGTLPLTVEGQPLVERGREPLTQTTSVSPEYFSAIRLTLKGGQTFSPSLTEKDPPVVVINESFAKRFWPGQSAIGRRIKVGNDEKWSEIIGIVADVKFLGRFEVPETPLQLYRHYLQTPSHVFSVVLRASVAPDALIKSVRDAVSSVDPDLPVAQAGDVLGLVDRKLSNINLVIINLGISAGMGLLIAGVGLYGVISQLSLQRTRDIGVRMALGAQHADILRLVMGGGVKLLLIGIAIGIPVFYGLHRLLSATMPAAEFPGAWLLGLNLIVLSATMLLACYLPARRATRVDPMIALRAD